MPEPSRTGRVLQVNVSRGGVPKDRVSAARVGRLGLDGDRHRDDTVHGGPMRAVCLLAIEVIERLEAEGHPIVPGSVGENLTTSGIELADLAAGTRLAIGDQVVLEITSPAMPCDTIVGSFRDGKSGRISVLVHPHDSRMYARVLREGVVREGDRIDVLPADAGSDVDTQLALFRIESAVRNRHIALWRAAISAGYEVEVVDDGELAIGTSHELPGPPFNLAFGLRSLPQFLPVVLERFRVNGTSGWFAFPGTPWSGAAAVEIVLTLVADPVRVAGATAIAGVDVREAFGDEPDAWSAGTIEPSQARGGVVDSAWPVILRELATNRASHRFAAVENGRVVGSAMLFTHRKVGVLTSASVVPDARGRGIQRGLIAARSQRAIELGCDLLVIEASVDNVASIRNAERVGFAELSRRSVYRFDPETEGERVIEETRAAVGAWLPLPPRELAATRPG